MGETSGSPDSDLVYSLYSDVFKPQLVRIALLLDLFSPLADGPADADAIAAARGCSTAGVRALLEYLCDLHLLERRGDAYALTPTAATFLVRGKRSYAGDWILMETGPEMWGAILQALHSGSPAHHEMTNMFTVLMWALTGGAIHSATDYQRWLAEAGFSRVKQLGEKWLSATKARD
jgi:hypothetical protein